MQECPICYNKIYIGIKQSECFDSHFVCYTCYYQSHTFRCCMCRRNSGIYEVYKSTPRKLDFICNEIPDSIDTFYHLVNYSKQTNTNIRDIIVLEECEELYPYIKGPIIRLYLIFSGIFFGLGCLFSVLYNINPSFSTLTRCFVTMNGVVCHVIGYTYVYIVANTVIMILSICSFSVAVYFMLLSIKIPSNPFKLLLFKKLKYI